MLGRGKRNWVWADLVTESVYYSSATDCWAQNMVTVHIQMKKEGQPRDLYPQWMLTLPLDRHSAVQRQGQPHVSLDGKGALTCTFLPINVSDLWIHFPKLMFDQLKAYRSQFQPFEIIFSLDLTCFSLSNMWQDFHPCLGGMEIVLLFFGNKTKGSNTLHITVIVNVTISQLKKFYLPLKG